MTEPDYPYSFSVSLPLPSDGLLRIYADGRLIWHHSRWIRLRIRLIRLAERWKLKSPPKIEY